MGDKMPKLNSDRIQKLLANAGYGSRREIEGWIEKGRVKLNGVLASLGDRATPRDKILIDNKPVKFGNTADIQTRVIAYHKPVGEISTRKDSEGRKTVFEKLPSIKQQRWISIGRLDINTSGLLLFTNNGMLANKLMHPSSEIEREYAVRIMGKPTNEQLESLKSGIKLDDGTAAFKNIVAKGGEGLNRWFNVVINEGRYREVRRLWKEAGFTVSRLIRVRFGPVLLPRDKRIGSVWDISQRDFKLLHNLVGIDLEPTPRPVTNRRGSRVKK